MSFHRTLSGQVAEFLFYSVPLVWVEGETDLPLFQSALQKKSCKLKSAGGKEECRKLADALIANGYPYIVILDGEYRILETTRNPHRRVIILRRHSSDNYLFEKAPLKRVCASFASSDTAADLVAFIFDGITQQVETALAKLVILDVAHQGASSGQRVLPDHANPLLESQGDFAFSSARISERCRQAQATLEPDQIAQAQSLVQQYLRDRPLVHILRGHIVFSLIRPMMSSCLRRARQRLPRMDNTALRTLIAGEVWKPPLSKDHRTLRRQLLRSVNDASEHHMFQVY